MPVREWLKRLGRLARRRRQAIELDDEIRAHFDELRDALERDGHSPGDAARLARLRLGGGVQIREAAQDVWRFAALEGLAQDLRFALRALGRRPAFAAAAVATLALGIGASTAIFSVAYGVSLRPLPYVEPGRLVRIYEANLANGQLEHDVSAGAFHEWRTAAPSIASAALFSKTPRRRFLAGDVPQPVTTMAVSPAFFEVLGVTPMLGAGFAPESSYTRFTTTDVVLSHATWTRFFSADPGIVGRTLRFADDEDPLRIVGVLPETFAFLEPVDIFQPEIVEVPVARLLWNWRYDRVIARLRPGATIERARTELDAISGRLAAERPTSNAGWTATIETLHQSVVGDFGRAAWLLFAAVAVVLLVACFNVGGLLIARGVGRQREMALRAALGAGRWRVLRLWLAEGALLAVIGTVIGVGLASLGVAALKAAAPPGIPRLDAVMLDRPALLVAAAAAMLATFVFAAAPAGFAFGRRREELVEALRTGSAGAGEGPARHRSRTALTMAQCAGAATLLVLGLMLTRSFAALMSTDLGWRPSGVISVQATPGLSRELRRPWYARVEWSDRLLARLRAIPGVDGAAITTQLPLGAISYGSTLGRGRGKQGGDDARWPAIEHKVSDDYFALMKIGLVAGRTFGQADRFSEGQMNYSERRPERGVALVSEQTARTLWPGQPAVGQSLWLPDIDSVDYREVVGVVRDIQFGGVGESPSLHVFLPWTQDSGGRIHVLVALRDGQGTAAAVDAVRAVAPGAAVDQVVTLDDLVARATAQPRFTSRLVAAFGALALVLVAVGTYGTLSFAVGTRTREIGIRLALGASRRRIVSAIVWRGLMPAILGGVLGLGVALVLARAFRALLFGIEPADLTSVAGGAAVLLIVAAAASLMPAQRAARVDPVRALRVE